MTAFSMGDSIGVPSGLGFVVLCGFLLSLFVLFFAKENFLNRSLIGVIRAQFLQIYFRPKLVIFFFKLSTYAS